MKKRILFFAFALFAISVKAQYPQPNVPYVYPNIDWKKYYSSIDTIGGSPSELDYNSNVYTTGNVGTTNANPTMICLKYDSLGILKYHYSYNSGGYNDGKSVKVDASGNGIFAGISHTSTTKDDGIIIKLSPLGVNQWTARFDRGFSKNDEFDEIALDASGNIYAVGYSENSAGNRDITVVKYSAAGSLLWSRFWDGGVANDDQGLGLVVSPSGTVYCTGYTTRNTGYTDIVTFALSAATGSLSWSNPIYTGGSANHSDKPSGIIIAGAEVVVCGVIENTSTSLDYVTVAYTPTSGAVLWSQTYNATTSLADQATSLAKDSANNIAVTGLSYNGSTYAYHTLLYHNNGVLYSTNIQNTGLNTVNTSPKIANDTIAHHWYVCGEISGASRDIYVYQISPSGLTAWQQMIDGAGMGNDAATSIGVNGVGVVYVSALSKNSTATYDYLTIKINQTPAYFVPDIVSNERPDIGHLYYENKGQILKQGTSLPATDVLFGTMNNYPLAYFGIDKISYKFYKKDTIATGHDSLQRIDIKMVGANTLATAYPFSPKYGKASFMTAGLTNAVTGVQGYERYFVPNIYPGIDVQYYSNEHGLKMYYVLKPGADYHSIIWDISGSTALSISGTNLNIKGFHGSIVFDKPTLYTVDVTTGAPTTVTANAVWSHLTGNQYHLDVTGNYDHTKPLIIELDYGNAVSTSPTGSGNLVHSTYYGGWWDDGIRATSVDRRTGNYACIGETEPTIDALQFPTIPGTTVSITTNTNSGQSDLFILLFDKDGNRLAVNTYGFNQFSMGPQNVILQNNLITVVGNNDKPSSSGPYPMRADMPTFNSTGPLTPGTYTSSNGRGYIVQFQYDPTTGSMNKINWATRLNGMAADIARTPDGNNIYVTTSLEHLNYSADTKTVSGSYNSNTYVGNNYTFKITKFDSLGIRKWATLYTSANLHPTDSGLYNWMHNNATLNMRWDAYLKCRISCDKYGFSIAGQTDASGLKVCSKYGKPIQNTFSGNQDGFFARFSKKDSITYSTYVGSSGVDMFTGLATTSLGKSVLVGFSTSNSDGKICPVSQSGFTDSTASGFGGSKILVIKFDTLGNKTYGSFYGYGGGTDVMATDVTLDNQNKAFITGKDLGGLNQFVTNPPGVYSNPSYANAESYMLCVTDQNYPIWNTDFGGKREDIGYSVDYNPINNSVIMTGMTSTNYTVVANESPYFPIAKNINTPNAWFQFELNEYNFAQIAFDGFISTFGANSVVGIEEFFNDTKTESSFEIFPNPTQNECSLAFKKELIGNLKLEIFDEVGMLMQFENRNSILPNSVITLKTSNLPNGLYIVKITGSDLSLSKKLIITNK